MRSSIQPEHVIMSLAARQHGVVARAQLLRAGVTDDLIDRRVAKGWLRRLHRGTYLVGPLAGTNTREMAATLACGEHAVVWRCSAAAVWQIPPGRRSDQAVEISVIRGHAGSFQDIRVRHVRTMRRDEVTVHDAIPITTPARTLFDLASIVAARDLERAVAEALALRIVQPSQVLSVVQHHARRPGAARLLAFLQDPAAAARTRSEGEVRFRALVRRGGLPDPVVNATIFNYEVDFLWNAERFIVEVDGRAFHASTRSFESDRRRDAVLLAHGFRTMRVTWWQIVNEPEALLVRLTQALGHVTHGELGGG